MTATPRPMKPWNRTWDLSSLVPPLFPLFASPKINGERCLEQDSTPLSSSGKRIRNIHIQNAFRSLPLSLTGLDGELVAGPDPTAPGIRRLTRSLVGSHHSLAPFTYWVFDNWNRSAPFNSLLHTQVHTPFGPAWTQQSSSWPSWIQPVPQYLICDLPTLLALEKHTLSQGFEGLIIRSPSGHYKQGRCTWREFESGSGLLKLKRFSDAEGTVTATFPLERNDNPPTLTPLGYTERSSSSSGKWTDDRFLGGLVVRIRPDPSLPPSWGGRLIRLGGATEGGWDSEERKRLQQEAHSGSLLGRLCTFRFFPEGDSEALPTQAKFVSWRDPNDRTS